MTHNLSGRHIASFSVMQSVLTLFAPLLSYFNIAPKQNKSFALMHPDFELNLITHIFRNFRVSGTTGSDVIFAFVRGILGVLCIFEQNACLSVRVFYLL